jgi:signal transduction histidine kinase
VPAGEPLDPLDPLDPLEAPSPLAIAALALVDEGATAIDLASRLAAEGVAPAADVPGRLLQQLAELGLVRVAHGREDGARYVVTSLGKGFLERSLGGDMPAELSDLERLRSTLLATIAHELRTPLTAIRTSAGLLLEPSIAPSAEQREAMLRTIERNAERMQRVINDVLDLSRYRSGAIRLQSRRFDALELARDVAEAIRPLTDQRRQRLTLRGDAPTMLFGDHSRLERALMNLVSNAQRFAPEGGEITLEVDRVGSDVRWRVSDNGPGISPADQRQLFERFFVGGADRGTEQAGVGLGLPTALAIAQAHGGTIEVDSAPGVGSTFTLIIPAVGSGPEDFE